MKPLHSLALTVVMVLFTPLAQAQASHPHPAPPSNATVGSTELTPGTVIKIDRAAHRLTLQHGEIKNLGMPPMTMAFRVRNAAQLEHLKVGDKLRFRAEGVDGGLQITQLEKAAP